MMHENDTYFANSNLSAWKVWYCLDNDKSRFAWADDSVDNKAKISWIVIDESFIGTRDTEADTTLNGTNYFAWYDENGGDDLYTTNEIPSVGDKIYTIARNMGGQTVTSEFSTVGSYSNATNLPNGRGVIYRLIDEYNNDIKYDFKNIQFKRTITNGQYTEKGTETWCYTLNVWHEDMCQDASIVGNTLPNDEGFVNGVYDNNFGYANTYNLDIEGVNTFAFALGNNVVLSFIDDGYFGIYSNIVGDGFKGNTIGDSFHHNTIGNDFKDNLTGNDFYSNTIRNGFMSNTIGHPFRYNVIGDSFCYNTIGNSFYFNTIGNQFDSNTIGNMFKYNIVGNGFRSNTINDYFNSNTIGNEFNSNIITESFVRYIRVEDGIEYVNITTSATTSGNAYLQNIIIGRGIAGTSSSRKTITHSTVGDTKQTTYVPTDSTTVNV